MLFHANTCSLQHWPINCIMQGVNLRPADHRRVCILQIKVYFERVGLSLDDLLAVLRLNPHIATHPLQNIQSSVAFMSGSCDGGSRACVLQCIAA